MKVRITPRAATDILEIETFIRQENPAAAARLANEIVDRCLALETASQRGPIIGLAKGQSIRRLVHGNYLIVYIIQTDAIRVLRIVHGARSPRLLLKNLDLP
ncbi:type II toxin-antitoxin system RelE/ParE family toxin [Hansschlegelia zhihuaiae]|uniref:Type II toxin-antitoxin system RelE/ParE family toxin n=1 Tax=Hansschlegelia zhihuaiae TaxID=405005 RepID=A0A4Q0MLU2_9HYPH|nr:type II toxin-antitoxin system RelE/ParE family toxin [Hansschlegelia zhihuaiae]RXF74787.1 type II toxin-antitoxin system RelE/ParE family toxin [Hansschlegelia zhihuaiae]